MKEKMYEVINKIQIVLFTILLIISPLYIGEYKNSYILYYIFLFFIINVLGLIKHIIKKQTYDKKLLYYLIFILSYFFPIIKYKEITYFNDHIKNIILMMLLLGTAINANNIFKNKKELLNKIIIVSATITSIISILYVFNPSIFNFIGIKANYSDYYVSSVYRLYGTLLYPNTLALLSLIGIILSLKNIEKNIIYKFSFYINMLSLMLTMSKSVLLFFIFAIIVICIVNKNIKYSLLAILIPILINTNIYRTIIINNDIILFSILTILLFCIYLIIYKIYSKQKLITSIIIISILILSVIFPYKDLTIKNHNRKLFITEFMDLKEPEYNIKLNIKGKNIKGKVYINEHFIMNESMSHKVIYEGDLTSNNEITFKTSKRGEYYSISIENSGSPIVIDKLLLEDKEVKLNSLIIPFNYIKSLEQSKYDIGSISGRLDIYKFAFELIKEKPLVGNGYNHFMTKSKDSENVKKVLVEHSQIMTLGVENGLFSVLFWIMLLITIIINTVRNISKKTIYEILVIYLLIYSSLYDFSMSYNFILLLLFIYSMMMLNDKQNDILLISSTGGHLSAMKKIMKSLNNKDYILITEKNKKTDTNANYVFRGSRGNIYTYIFIMPINAILNIIYFIHYNPKIILTTGSHTGVFMCYLGKLFKRKIIFIEVYDRFNNLTLSGKLVYKIADCFIVQHKKLQEKYPKSIYIGEMY